MDHRRALDELIAASRGHETEVRETLHRIMRTCSALERIREIGTDEQIARVVTKVKTDVPEIVPS